MTAAAKNFLSDMTKNLIKKEEIRLSKIFLWYAGDFKKEGSLIEYINRYAPVEVDKDAKKSYLDYNWNLNE